MLEIRTFLTVLNEMKKWIIANQDKISDFNAGSVTLSMLEAIAQQFEQAFIKARVGYAKSLRYIPYQTFDFIKKESLSAAGAVVFSRTTPAESLVSIPIGTIVATSAGAQFQTTAGAFIQVGAMQSNSTAVVAVKGGRDGNVLPGAINQIPAPILGVEAVTNALATTGGIDAETDYEFELRFREFIEGLGKSSEAGLITAAKTVNSVRAASFVEHDPALDGIYHGTLYLDDGSGSASPETIAQVADIINGDGTESNPGYRAAGMKYRITAPTVVLIDIVVTVEYEAQADRYVTQQEIINALTNYINSLTIGMDIIKNRLIDAIMEVNGVRDITLSTPAGNVAIGDNQIARIGTVTIQ